MNDVLSLLGLAKKAGKLELGEEPVGAACRSRKARVVLLASDAAANTMRRASHFGQAGQVPFVTIPFTKVEIGQMAGRSTCAMSAVTDVGLAAALLSKLAASDPETYGAAAGLLHGKAEKALQRQKENLAHEKKLQRAKNKPWAPKTGGT